MFDWDPFRLLAAEAAGPRQDTAARESAERLAGVVTLLAAVASCAIALAVPVTYLAAAHTRIAGVVEARAEIYADAVLAATEQNPALWNALLDGTDFDAGGLPLAAADPMPDAMPPEQRRVFAANRRPLIEVPPALPLAWPTVAARAPIVQNGHALGEVEITRSLRPALLWLLPIAAGSVALGLALLAALRIMPLRVMQRALDLARHASAHDALTNLPNRALFIDRLEQALLAARRDRRGVGLLCLDLDRFKDINDTLGHAAGDLVLRQVAARLRTCLRESDTIARLDGDEFAIILRGVQQPWHIEEVALKLLARVQAPFDLDGHPVTVGLSIGAAFTDGACDAGELTKQADIALCQAKEAGRGGHCFYAPEMERRRRERRELEADLRAALQAGQLAVHYQPKIDVASGTVVGAEALMRWTRPGPPPEGGPVSPMIFIPVAEEIGLIAPLGAWILEQACREASTWPAHMHVAVNVSPVQFRQPGFLDTVQGALTASGLHPRRLELEVTEGILLHDTEETLAILASLRALGIRLAMDDFGTGYASLGYLNKFRFDKIKIDKSFVRSLGSDRNAAAIVRAVVGLSDELGIETNAEGVEYPEQLEMLRRHGCREVQGYLFWAPMPAEDFRQLLPPVSAAAPARDQALT